MVLLDSGGDSDSGMPFAGNDTGPVALSKIEKAPDPAIVKRTSSMGGLGSRD